MNRKEVPIILCIVIVLFSALLGKVIVDMSNLNSNQNPAIVNELQKYEIIKKRYNLPTRAKIKEELGNNWFYIELDGNMFLCRPGSGIGFSSMSHIPAVKRDPILIKEE